jgi:hypothetical protein
MPSPIESDTCEDQIRSIVGEQLDDSINDTLVLAIPLNERSRRVFTFIRLSLPARFSIAENEKISDKLPFNRRASSANRRHH